MRFIQCPECGWLAAAKIDSVFEPVYLKCPNCGFVDYPFAFANLSKWKQMVPFQKMRECLNVIHNNLEGWDRNDATTFIDTIHRQCSELSPLMIAHIINAWLSKKKLQESNESSLRYESLFVKYEHSQIEKKDSNVVQNDAFIKEYNALIMEIENLRSLNEDLNQKIQNWIEDYNILKHEYERLLKTRN